MEFVKLGSTGHTWTDFASNWRAICEEYDDDFDDYAWGIISVLKPLCEKPERQAAAFAVFDGSEYHSICQLNCKPIKGHNGPVLRMRHLTINPHYDLGCREVADYAKLMIKTVIGIWRLSEAESSDFFADTIKFHMKSPADRVLFHAMGEMLGGVRKIKTTTHGGWLELTKT